MNLSRVVPIACIGHPFLKFPDLAQIMKFVSILLPFVAFAISCTAIAVPQPDASGADEPYKYDDSEDVGKGAIEPHDVKWKQTEDKPLSQLKGGLGSSVEGFFPDMSAEKVGLGCGLNWDKGQLHAGFDGGDPNSGVGGGFTWTKQALSSIVGVHFGETKINLNLTVTDQNKVLFTINDKDVDWNQVMQLTTKPIPPQPIQDGNAPAPQSPLPVQHDKEPKPDA